MSRLSLFLNVLWAESYALFTEIFRRKHILIMMSLYPYMLLVFILIIGYSVGSRQVFIQRLGVAPEVFFLASGYLLMAVLGSSDDLLWRPLYDDWLGITPYLIISPVPRLYRFLAVPLPRLVIALITGLTSLLPLMIWYYGFYGLIESFAVIIMTLVATIVFVPFIMAIIGVIYTYGKEQWRVLNILRPLLLILLGVYYPRFLMPLGAYIASALVPPSHVVEAVQRLLIGRLDLTYSLMLFGAAIGLFIAYIPAGVYSISLWERNKLKHGVKTE